MKNKRPKKIAERVQEYLEKPYRIVIERDDQGVGYAVWVEELPGCMSYGDTPEEALQKIREAMELWIETALEDGDPIPEPLATREYSGRFLVRLPKSLHQRLVEQAQREGVSLNALVTHLLSQGVVQRTLREEIRHVLREEWGIGLKQRTFREEVRQVLREELAALWSHIPWPSSLSAQQGIWPELHPEPRSRRRSRTPRGAA